jgi:hypothetical protein
MNFETHNTTLSSLSDQASTIGPLGKGLAPKGSLS